MKLNEIKYLIEKVGHSPANADKIVKAMIPIAGQKVVWRGMNGGTAFSLVNNERKGFRGALSDQATDIMRYLKIENPAFGSYSQAMTTMFGSLKAMVPIDPYRAMQSDKLRDLVLKSDLDPNEIKDSYSERMDIEDSEVVFDIKEYYLINIHYVIERMLDPDGMAEGRLNKQINEKVKEIKTYQDIIDAMSKDPNN